MVIQPTGIKMVALSQHDTDRAKFHTGIVNIVTISAQDVSRLLEACANIEGNYAKDRVIDQLDRCDAIWKNTDMTQEPANEKRLYSGDVNRTEVYFALGEAMRLWNDAYLRETDRLCKLLAVPNYHRVDFDRYQFERSGASFIEAIPGPKDTAVYSSIGETAYLGGAFGF
ncbi:hypothetical protein [Nodosilinea nodulosa]|uniref:hypothetical protein n=1 Tax=Nodosilinea nodulosa TaxID=416001 RepID=UPI000369C837|nr:hypothetical protein [Nodosilinea nodulosa]